MVLGLTIGLEIVDVKPEGLLTHLYVSPLKAVDPIWVLLLLQMVVGLPGFVAGNGLMLIFLKEESWQLDATTFSNTLTLPELPDPQTTVILLAVAADTMVPPCTTHV